MGEDNKVTIMVLKVDLQCEKCYRKVKKVLCKFPQIRDQMYDEKNNQVIIKVVCCNPEKIRDKLCCKGRCVITSIEIKEPPPEKTEKNVKSPPEKTEKEKHPPEKTEKEKPPPEKREKEKPPPVTCTCPPVTCVCPPVPPPVKCPRRPVTCPQPPPPVKCPRPPVKCLPLPPPVTCPRPPVNTCCTECYEGRPGGPCETGYGYGVPGPYIQYDGYCGRPVYDSYGGWRSYNTGSYCMTRPNCFSEENPQACAIM